VKIIFINGPPRSGKDTAGEILAEATGGELFKFAEPLKLMAHRLVSAFAPHAIPERAEHAADFFEDVKDEPQPYLFGKTWRQYYIAVSETLIKPLHGDDFFGKVLATDIANLSTGTAIITDSGFMVETPPIVERFGAENCLLLRMRRTGCNFSSDSREYLELPGVVTIDVYNDRGVDELRSLLLNHTFVN